MKVLFAVNPCSGVKRPHHLPSIIDEHCPWDHEIAENERSDDLDAVVARAIRERFDVVYAVGGDGTVHEVARRLIGTPVALGIIPTGSGNGFARHLGLPMAVERSLGASRGGRIVLADTATVNGMAFIATMGVGFDAWIAAEFAGRTARGFRTYARVALGGFFSHPPEEYEIDADGERLRRTAMVIAVANASQYGNNVRIAAAASIQDGLLDVVIVERRSLSMAARLFTGSLHHARGVTTRRARHIEIRRPAPGPAHLDGEPVALPELLTIDVVPGSLRILVPDDATAI